MGGGGGTHSRTCNNVTQDIWTWAISRNIWFSAAYIPPGDTAMYENTEWALNTDIFVIPPKTFFQPEIDLFASALNHQVSAYISWFAVPNAYAVNAFTVSWTDLKFYAFPPFSLIPRLLAKNVTDHATGLLIIPQWATQL